MSASAFCSQRKCFDDTARRGAGFKSEPLSVRPSSEEILRQFNNLCQQMYTVEISMSDQWPKKLKFCEGCGAAVRC